VKKDSLYLHVLPFTLRWLATAAILAVSALFSLAVDTDPVPLDPTVRVGRLPNGLTYYLRQNAKPENRLELRLVVNAGSVLEDDDQRGMAHFVEHLAFRGTARYSGVELIHYLQSLGAGFGPDVNARTSFDETVYQLTIPADSEEGVRKGVGILADWAHGVMLSDDAIATERNVVLEEWRLGRGSHSRWTPWSRSAGAPRSWSL
jgi:zinc protease